MYRECAVLGVPILTGDTNAETMNTAQGKFTLTVNSGADQLYRDQQSDRMKSLHQTLFDDGRHRGATPYGYRTIRDVVGRRHLEIAEDEASTVRLIFTLLSSLSFSGVANALTHGGIPARRREWTEDGIKDIWRRRRLYQGFVTKGRGLYERPGLHEPIIDDVLLRGAMTGIAQRKNGSIRRPSQHRTYIASGLLRCGVCDARLRGATQQKHDRTWRYYRCPRGHGSIKGDKADAALLARVRAGALPPVAVQRAREELRRRLAVPEQPASEAQRQKLQTRLERLAMRFEWGEIDGSEYRAKRAEVEGSLTALPDPDKLVSFDRFATVAATMAEAIDKAKPEDQAELLRMLLVSVPVENGELGIPVWTMPARAFFDHDVSSAPPEGFEPPTPALGRRRSIH